MTARTPTFTYASELIGPAEDLSAIHTTIDHYIEGMRDGDVGRLREGFHPLAVMFGYLGDATMATPIQGLYDFVAANPSPSRTGEATACDVTRIEVTRGTATAEVAERSYMGHDFKTSFQLIKLDGRWWISAKLFDGVPRR